MRPEPFILTSERLTLRRFQPSDLSDMLAYGNDPEITRYQGWDVVSETEGRAFIEAQQLQPIAQAGNKFQIAIERRTDAQLIGDIALTTDGSGQAEIGYTLGRAFQGKGYMTEAVKTLLSFVFTELQIHRVIACVDDRNIASFQLLERLGFRREAHYIDAVRLKQQWASEYHYALLAREWLALQVLTNVSKQLVQP